MSSETPSIHILDRPVTRIGVIGSGQIGPDIALHFSKVFTPMGTSIVVVDISEEALELGKQKLDRTLLIAVFFRCVVFSEQKDLSINNKLNVVTRRTGDVDSAGIAKFNQ